MSTAGNQKGQKSGPLSKVEKEYIADNCDEYTPEEMADHLKRNAKTVKRFIQAKLGKVPKVARQAVLIAEYDIRKSPVWQELKNQFTPKELDMFLHHWGQIISQFRDDVFHTEEWQIADAIKLELLMSRALAGERQLFQKIVEWEQELDKLKKQGAPIDELVLLEEKIAIAYSQKESLNKDFRDMLDKKNKMLQALKATRDQRVKQLEDSKKSFAGWITEVLSNVEVRKQLGVRMEKMRLATEVEQIRLSEYHKFEDGELDKPFLIPEDVDKEHAENAEKVKKSLEIQSK
jgi:hypothetical protein